MKKTPKKTTTKKRLNKKPKQPNIIFAAQVNLSGLYSNEPIRCTRDNEMDSWCDVSGDFIVDFIGDNSRRNSTVFSSEKIEDVINWIKGAEAVMNQLREFSWKEE